MEAPGDDGGPDAGTRARGLGRGRGRVDMITVLGKVRSWEFPAERASHST